MTSPSAWVAPAYLEMNVYKPLMIFNIAHSITIMTDSCVNFRRFLIEGKPNLKKINRYVERSLMLVTTALRLSSVTTKRRRSPITPWTMILR